MLAIYNQCFRLISHISQSIYDDEDLDRVLETILENIATIFKARGCALRILDGFGDELGLKAATGLSREFLDKGPVLASRSLSDVFGDDPVVIRNVATDPRVQYPDAAAREGIVSILAFPFAIIDRMRMVLRIYFDREIDFCEEKIGLIRALAEQGAIAIKHSLTTSRYFETFRKISTAIHTGGDTGEILRIIVHQITDIMEGLGCIFWILDTREKLVRTKVSHGFAYRSLAEVDYDTVAELFGTDSHEPVFIDDARYDQRIPDLERLGKKRVVAIVGLPVQIVAPYVGVLAVYFSHPRTLAASEVKFLSALSEQGAIALHRALRYDENVLKTFRETVEVLITALEAKDLHTHGHSLKVAHYARLTARALGLDDAAVETVYRAGMLHDIGKIGMDDRLLKRLGKLSVPDMETVKTHPVIGARILKPLGFLDDLAPLVLYHHERYDGSGYPEGISGETIPLGARILAACDAFDTMISGRPNIPRKPLNKALEQLRCRAGSWFDPQVVEMLVTVIEKDPESVRPYETPESYFKKYREELRMADASGIRKDPWALFGPSF